MLGAVLDGIPESVVIGASLLTGETASVAVIVAVFLSNIPESISASSDLLRGWVVAGCEGAAAGVIVVAATRPGGRPRVQSRPSRLEGASR